MGTEGGSTLSKLATTSVRGSSSAPAESRHGQTWSWARIWAVSLAAAICVGLLEATHGYIGFRLAGQPAGGFTMPETTATWLNLASRALPSWIWMGLIAPGAVWMARRLPLQPGMPLRNIAIHFAGAFLYTWLFVLGAATFRYSLFVHQISDAGYWTVVLRYYAIFYNLTFFYYWTLVAVYSALRYYREARDREVEKQRLEAIASEARLEALRRQLHPHFLFNLLNAISSMVLEGEPRGAVRALSDVSRLLRISFSRSEPFIPLAEELRFLETYVDLHKLRLQERLHLEISVDGDLLGAEVPTFLLQPLVENAIEHGIALRADGGTVRVEAARAGDRLDITVRNPVPIPDGNRPASSGVGLANTEERIAGSYGEAASFDFQVTGEQAVATLRLPFRELAAKEEPRSRSGRRSRPRVGAAGEGAEVPAP